MSKRIKGLLAGSYDPFTYGHKDLALRALKFVDHLVIATGINPNKTSMFSFEEKKKIIEATMGVYDNIEITYYEGSLVDYVYSSNFDVVFRGSRNSMDYENEQQLYNACQSQGIPIEFILLPARKEFSDVSSSNVKAWQSSGGFIHSYVHPYTKQCVEARMSGQYFVGLTGIPASGKSYIANELVKLGKEWGIPVFNIDMDKIAHDILSGEYLDEYSFNKHLKIRQQIITEFEKIIYERYNEQLMLDPETLAINRKVLAKLVFSSEFYLKALNSLMKIPMEVAFREAIKNKRGLILINAPLLIEADWLPLCNNNVILVSNIKTLDKMRERIKEGKFPKSELNTRLTSQLSTQKKFEFTIDRIKKENHGQIFNIKNNYKDLSTELNVLLTEIIRALDQYGELRYTSAWNKLSMNGTPTEEYKKLVINYNRPHRHYHTLEHIMFGVDCWDFQFRGSIIKMKEKHSPFYIPYEKGEFKNPYETLLAWFYHDFVMDPLSKVDEMRSSNYLMNLLSRELIPKEKASYIANLIIHGTSHKENIDEEITVLNEIFLSDWDLLIFGRSKQVYDNYKNNIRREYYYVDNLDYVSGRISILNRFLNKARKKGIYYFYKRHNDCAINNIEKEIEELKSKLKIK